MLNKYPTPVENMHCRCQHPVAQMFCQHGHMTECHFPYHCQQAGCTHVPRYDVDIEIANEYAATARSMMQRGDIPIYTADENGNITAHPADVDTKAALNDMKQLILDDIRIDVSMAIETIPVITGAIALALRHPAFVGEMTEMATEFINHVIEKVRPHSQAVAEMIEQGFDPAFDQ